MVWLPIMATWHFSTQLWILPKHIAQFQRNFSKAEERGVTREYIKDKGYFQTMAGWGCQVIQLKAPAIAKKSHRTFVSILNSLLIALAPNKALMHFQVTGQLSKIISIKIILPRITWTSTKRRKLFLSMCFCLIATYFQAAASATLERSSSGWKTSLIWPKYSSPLGLIMDITAGAKRCL